MTRLGKFALVALFLVSLGSLAAYQITGSSQPATAASSGSGGVSGKVLVKVTLTEKVHHIHYTQWWSGDNLAMLAHGYSTACLNGTNDFFGGCSGGYTYTIDPTVHVVNNGMEFIECKVANVVGSITCTGADFADYLSVSVSSSYTPLFTDTTCHATVQTTNGYSVILGTLAGGTASGGSVQWTASHKWTDTTSTVSNIDLACIQTENTGGGNVLLWAEGQITSTTTAVGDSLETDWTVTATSA